MTLLSSLRKMPDVDIVPINFSSETNFNLIIKTLELHCKYTKSCSRVTLSPKNDRWLILFCDEINLPKPDPYGTQRVNSFIRQLVESRGFWRSDRVWISIEKIQIVGACNPPSDPGRIALDPRFLRHLSVLFVDYPGEEALLTIYGTLSRAALKVHPELRGFSSSLAQAIVGLYAKVKITFSADQQAHYIYSPRELTRWIRGIHEILARAEFVSISDLVTIWAHEAIRLFQDRLVTKTEETELEDIIYKIASSHFPGVDLDTCLSYPILFSNFFSSNYEMVEKEALQQFVQDRLQLFYEEDLDKPLVLHDSALDHILRIDRVFRQTQGHALLIGISGSGKTYLTRFVSWMNGITFFQPSMHAKYSIEDFEEDLRVILRRSG
jgi:dynein heavy chain 1, cytosolic